MPMAPMAEADRKKAQPQAAVAVGADTGHFAMPETSFPIRTPGRAPAALPVLALLLAGAALAGCSGGDFGRTRSDFLNDDMHRWIGGEATGSVGLQGSQFPPTENERLLRDLAYPLIEPPHSRPAWRSVFGDYKPLASPWRQQVVFDRTAYGRTLIDEPHRSSASRSAPPLGAACHGGAAPPLRPALCPADGRRPRRHPPVRAVLRRRCEGDRSRQE